MSKVVFDALILLAGVVVGGLVTYFTTTALESKKWAERKKDKQQEHRREALALALEWIPPIEVALSQASLTASRFLKHEMSTNEFLASWPNLLSQLEKKDLPMRLSVLLPAAVQQRTNGIVRQLRELQSFVLWANSASRANKEDWKKSFQAFPQRAGVLDEQ